jgi:putative component of toxin-antitoxin plasmid stabilization module
MLQVQQTDIYARWFSGLRDRVARARIDVRIRRLSMGSAGGDKSSQDRDIRVAKALARDLQES